MNTYQYRVIVSNSGCSSATSTGGILTVNALPTANAGSNITICSGANTQLGTTSVAGNTYSWYPSTGLTTAAGVSSSTISNPWAKPGSTTTYTLTETKTSTGCSKSSSVVVTVSGSTTPSITLQPVNQNVCPGNPANFWVHVSGTHTSQWQQSTDNGVTFSNLSSGGNTAGATTDSLQFNSSASSNNGYIYRCLVSNGGCTVTSNTASLTKISKSNSNVSVSISPSSPNVCATCATTLTATGNTPGLTYQWQISTTSGGSTYTNITDGGTSPIYSGAYAVGNAGTTSDLVITNAPSSLNGYNFRVIATNSGCGISTNSSPVALTVNTSPVVTAQPSNSLVCQNNSSSFSVIATGASLTYAWQVSTDGGSTWTTLTNISPYSNVTTATLSISSAALSYNGYQYRARVANASCSVYSSTAILTVNIAPSIYTNPVSTTTCAGTATTYSVVLLQGTNISYQWQVSSNGGTSFSNISDGSTYSGTTGSSLIVTPTYSMNSYQFRVVVSTTSVGCSTATSTAATITVNPNPGDNAGADIAICLGGSTNIGASPASGRTYSWTSSPSGFTSSSANPSVSPTVTTTYTLTETITSTGCNSTNTVVVTVNPNPGNNAGADATICSGGSTNIGAASTSGRTYSWTSSPSGFTSSSANPSVSPTVTTTYTLTETITATGCNSTNTVVVTVTPLTQANAGTNQNLTCGSTSTTLAGNTITYGSGVWTKISGNGSITNSNSPSTTITGLTSGASIFRWTASNGSCSNYSEVTIRTNCPSVYSVSPIINIDSLKTGTSMATASDPDGSIVSASISSGTLPAGLSLASNGTIAVSSQSSLVPGYAYLTILLTDDLGGTTSPSIIITIESDQEASYTAPTHSSYSNSDTLCYVTDANGDVTSANITSGTLPAGVSFNSSTGLIYVSNSLILVSGTYNFSIRTTDETGGISSASASFTLSGISLPVTLIYFKGDCVNNQVELNWATASEINNNYFSVERSEDGRSWQVIGNVKGNGTTSEMHSYSYTDEHTSSFHPYYRLKQTDYDGRFEYFNIISMEGCSEQSEEDVEHLISIFPNPTSGKLTLSSSGSFDEFKSIEIYNALGARIYSDSHVTSAIDLSGRAPGLYFIHLKYGSKTYTSKILLRN